VIGAGPFPFPTITGVAWRGARSLCLSARHSSVPVFLMSPQWPDAQPASQNHILHGASDPITGIGESNNANVRKTVCPTLMGVPKVTRDLPHKSDKGAYMAQGSQLLLRHFGSVFCCEVVAPESKHEVQYECTSEEGLSGCKLKQTCNVRSLETRVPKRSYGAMSTMSSQLFRCCVLTRYPSVFE